MNVTALQVLWSTLVAIIYDSPAESSLRSQLRENVRDSEFYLPSNGFEYDQRRRVTNGACRDMRPAAIVVPRSKEAVSDAIVWARQIGLEISVRSGGHSYTCTSIRQGGLHLDLRQLDKVDLLADETAVRLGPGSTWYHVLYFLPPSKYTIIHGNCGSVG